MRGAAWFAGGLAGLFGLVCAASLLAGELLSRPVPGEIGPPPEVLPAFRSVDIAALGEGGTPPVAGWFAHGRQGGGAVLLLHGIRGSRLDMVERARFLSGQGYAVLLVDLPAHGESRAEHISFGLKEAEAVKAAFAFLGRELPGEKVGVIGVSLGAASMVFASEAVAPSAVVLESMYPTIEEAVGDRLRLHLGPGLAPLAEAVAPLLLRQLPWRLGVSAAQLRPIDLIPRIHAPILIASGSLDRHTTEAETRRIYAAAHEPKALWIVDGAAHINLYAFNRPLYEAKVFGFLAQYLRGRP